MLQMYGQRVFDLSRTKKKSFSQLIKMYGTLFKRLNQGNWQRKEPIQVFILKWLYNISGQRQT